MPIIRRIRPFLWCEFLLKIWFGWNLKISYITFQRVKRWQSKRLQDVKELCNVDALTIFCLTSAMIAICISALVGHSLQLNTMSCTKKNEFWNSDPNQKVALFFNFQTLIQIRKLLYFSIFMTFFQSLEMIVVMWEM